jgi:hypothetical protein
LETVLAQLIEVKEEASIIIIFCPNGGTPCEFRGRNGSDGGDPKRVT